MVSFQLSNINPETVKIILGISRLHYELSLCGDSESTGGLKQDQGRKISQNSSLQNKRNKRPEEVKCTTASKIAWKAACSFVVLKTWFSLCPSLMLVQKSVKVRSQHAQIARRSGASKLGRWCVVGLACLDAPKVWRHNSTGQTKPPSHPIWLPTTSPGSPIHLVWLYGVLQNTPAFKSMPVPTGIPNHNSHHQANDMVGSGPLSAGCHPWTLSPGFPPYGFPSHKYNERASGTLGEPF